MTRSVEPKGSPQERPHLLLELARDGCLDRQVPGVMRTRGDLINQEQAFVGQEELDGQNTDGRERLGHGQRSPRASSATIGPTGAGMSVASKM